MTNYTLIKGMNHEVVTEVLLEEVIAVVELHRAKIFPPPSPKRLPAAQGFGRRGFAQAGSPSLPSGPEGPMGRRSKRGNSSLYKREGRKDLFLDIHTIYVETSAEYLRATVLTLAGKYRLQHL